MEASASPICVILVGRRLVGNDLVNMPNSGAGLVLVPPGSFELRCDYIQSQKTVHNRWKGAQILLLWNVT